MIEWGIRGGQRVSENSGRRKGEESNEEKKWKEKLQLNSRKSGKDEKRIEKKNRKIRKNASTEIQHLQHLQHVILIEWNQMVCDKYYKKALWHFCAYVYFWNAMINEQRRLLIFSRHLLLAVVVVIVMFFVKFVACLKNTFLLLIRRSWALPCSSLLHGCSLSLFPVHQFAPFLFLSICSKPPPPCSSFYLSFFCLLPLSSPLNSEFECDWMSH